MDRQDGDPKEEDEIHSDGSLVHAASTSCKEDVHDDGHGDASKVHSQCASNEDTPPHTRVCLFNLLNAELGECVCQIHQQYQPQQEEEDRTGQSDIVSPDLEEPVGDEEADHDQSKPDEDLGSPPSVLD